MLTASFFLSPTYEVANCSVTGFNVAPISNPGSFEDIVELLVPELQRRGLMQTEYSVPGGTLRENLTRVPGQKYLMDDHYGATFAWERNPGKEIRSKKRSGGDLQKLTSKKANTASVKNETINSVPQVA